MNRQGPSRQTPSTTCWAFAFGPPNARLSRFYNRPLLFLIDTCPGSGCGAAVPVLTFKNSELAGAAPFTCEVQTIHRQPAAQDLTDRCGETGHALFKTKILQRGQLV